MAFIQREIELNGSRLCYREAGSGPVLLFLHGAGGAESALPFLLPFTADHRVLVPDHPGFGRSADPAWLDDIHDVAYAYLDFLDALDLRGVHLLGTSLGGWVAMEIAIRCSARLASLTVVAAPGIPPGDIPTGDLFGWGPEERVRQLVASPAFAARILALPQTAEQAQAARRNDATTARLSGQPRFVDRGLGKWLHRIRVPTLVAWGDTDRLFPPEYGRRLAWSIPGARFTLLRDCGHLPQVEQPDVLADLVRQHVAGTGFVA
ncbi:MAG: alpha/beta hydrolase [Steroidobacteraceae bacterium]|jgi:pimeloyl-ACP methyl ester carboxylesterase|nr:alpha/beta hydrolase [Steroidobacteraceae bacterium]